MVAMPKGEAPQVKKGAKSLKLEQVGRVVSVAPGTRVVRQGGTPEYFYVLKSGRLRVFRESKEGIRTDLTELGPGAYFGEVALVTGKPRTASVEALEESELIQISKAEFDWVLDNNPGLARHIIQQLSQWLVAGDQRLESEVVHQVRLREISWFDYVLLIGLSVILALGFNFSNPNGIPLVQGWGEKDAVPQIALSQALKEYRNGEAVFVDARPTNFFDKQRIKGAKNLPLPLFDFLYLMQLSQVDKDQPIIVYGRNISRHYDEAVARKLLLRGHSKVMILGGGSNGWKNNDFPLEP
jgi:rhodanese-related sulfurtransferase